MRGCVCRWCGEAVTEADERYEAMDGTAVHAECMEALLLETVGWRHWRSAWGMNTDGRWRWMQNGEKGFEPVWCPFYREDSGRSIYCEGITDESFLRLTFASGRAKRQQMEIFCRTKNCEKCELYTAINARYADD